MQASSDSISDLMPWLFLHCVRCRNFMVRFRDIIKCHCSWFNTVEEIIFFTAFGVVVRRGVFHCSKLRFYSDDDEAITYLQFEDKLLLHCKEINN